MELIHLMTMTDIFLFYPYLQMSNQFQGLELYRGLSLLWIILLAHHWHRRCCHDHRSHLPHLHHLASNLSEEHRLRDPHGDLALALVPQDHLVEEELDRHRAKQDRLVKVDLWMMDHAGPEGKGKF